LFVSRSEMVRGATAGLVGTIAYTMLSAQLKRRSGQRESMQPLTAARAVVNSQVSNPDGLRKFALNALLHWGYGAWGGAIRVVVERRGLRGLPAEATHLAAFWLPWRLVLTSAGARTGARALAVDLTKHVVYVLVTGVAYRALGDRSRR